MPDDRIMRHERFVKDSTEAEPEVEAHLRNLNEESSDDPGEGRRAFNEDADEDGEGRRI
jgi:hypothetical protein